MFSTDDYTSTGLKYHIVLHPFITLNKWDAVVADVVNENLTTVQKDKKWKEIAGKCLRLKVCIQDVQASGSGYAVSWSSLDEAAIPDYSSGKTVYRTHLTGVSYTETDSAKKLNKGEVITVRMRVPDEVGILHSEGKIE